MFNNNSFKSNKSFNSNFNKKTKTLTLQTSNGSYYFALHELFHFITCSQKRKTRRNFGYVRNNFYNKMTVEEMVDEIKTIFLSSIWINDNFLLPYGCLGMRHQFIANNTTNFCSLFPFGKYKKIMNPRIELNKNSVVEIAKGLKFINEKLVQSQKVTFTGEHQYRDIEWQDYLLTANDSLKAVEELTNNNFLTENADLKSINDWKI